MPHARRTLTTAAAEQLCAAMFAPSEQRVGLELEWPVHGHGDVTARPGPGEMSQITRCRLPCGSRVTFATGMATVQAAEMPSRRRASTSRRCGRN